MGDLSRFLANPYRPFGFLAPKTLIIWLSNLSILSVPDRGNSRNASPAVNFIYTFLFLSKMPLNLHRIYLICHKYVSYIQ